MAMCAADTDCGLPARGRRLRVPPAEDRDVLDTDCDHEKTEEGEEVTASHFDGEEGGSGCRNEQHSTTRGVDKPKPQQFEYVSHTADVGIRAWGDTLTEAFEQAGVALFGYMTDLSLIEEREIKEIVAEGVDLRDVFFHFMDELLFLYGGEYFISSRLIVTCDNKRDEAADAEEDVVGWQFRAKCFGEKFDRSRHSQGTEVKAITMHGMDVCTPETSSCEHERIDGEERQPHDADEAEGTADTELSSGFKYRVLVLLDI